MGEVAVKILLVGHTGGIGSLLRKKLTEQGHNVVGVSRSNGFDLQNDMAYEKIAQHLHGSPVDIVVFNSGVLAFGSCDLFTFDDLFRVTIVNAWAPLLATRTLLRDRLIRGSIFCMLSHDIYDHPKNQILYNCSKAWVAEWVLSASRELLSKGIRVNGLALGLVDTGMYHTCVDLNAFDPSLPVEPMPADKAVDFAVDCILNQKVTGEIWKLPSFQ
jgi:NAD(P)-dependent dehydrogenase (short-subunit alcohol dehydrogenase family)